MYTVWVKDERYKQGRLRRHTINLTETQANQLAEKLRAVFGMQSWIGVKGNPVELSQPTCIGGIAK